MCDTMRSFQSHAWKSALPDQRTEEQGGCWSVGPHQPVRRFKPFLHNKETQSTLSAVKVKNIKLVLKCKNMKSKKQLSSDTCAQQKVCWYNYLTKVKIWIICSFKWNSSVWPNGTWTSLNSSDWTGRRDAFKLFSHLTIKQKQGKFNLEFSAQSTNEKEIVWLFNRVQLMLGPGTWRAPTHYFTLNKDPDFLPFQTLPGD